MIKKGIALALITIQILLPCCNTGTDNIEYGSNDGKQLIIFNKKIYYEEYGQGTPLILLSGGGLNRSIKDFENCIPGLAKHYRVIAPDTPGQGRSEQADTLTYGVLLEFSSRLIDSLKIDSAYVMGWSDGAITGILLAERRPDKIRKVIAVGANNGLRRAIPPDIPIDSVYPMTLDYFERTNKELIERYTNTPPGKDWKKYMNDANAMVYQKESYFSDSIYGRINIPVMIVLGDQDDIIVEHGLEMHRLIKGSQFCILPNTTHEVFAERPDLINKIAMDFFK
ncbi:alpha/beta fold hydrolase [Dawidia soli]|uniref:Alpha/beta hydrolase n=1 Tax=Dawidia soli TaxID=2782352 RepID=A0AAP2DD67_9BACT|nr:alpha/beta hydrolase [Dawidia soli]MBT1688575.1 alpha/beta hydrolase [Dawidia soli]